METGSLLSEALRYMQQIRQNEQQQQLPFDFSSGRDGSNEAEHGGTAGVGVGVGAGGMNGNVNTLILSLYCIDGKFDILYKNATKRNDDDDNGNDDGRRKKQKELHQHLAKLHSIIHSDLLPKYQKAYPHVWFAGGEGLSFGLHCSDGSSEDEYNNNTQNNNSNYNGEAIPHLRAVVRYGPHPIDEFHAIAIMMKLSHDLKHNYQIHTAASCWDVDDGHILLIEGSSSSSADADANNLNGLPGWVDDIVGVEGMNNRVYIVNGQIQLLDPSIKGLTYKDTNYVAGVSTSPNCYHLTKKESLFALQSKKGNEDGNHNYQCSGDELKLNSVIQERFRPFIQALSSTSTSGSSQQHQEQQVIKRNRKILQDHIHTAAIVLPLQIALLIKQRSDLIPCAILQFCSMAPLQQKKKKKKAKTNHNQPQAQAQSSSSSLPSSFGREDEIKFENLVITTITIPKSLYAMLLTCAGQIQPPMKIPKQYKSVELNRMKRKCLLGGEGYSHFRHSIEVGIRLTLGFEWIINGGGKDTDNTGGGKGEVAASSNGENSKPKITTTESSVVSSTSLPYNRILYHCRIDREACLGLRGGTVTNADHWIEEAWKVGPNSTNEENDIGAIIKCPVWNPEIIMGGICPLSHPGMSASTHIRNTIRKIEKQEGLSSSEMSMSFPFPQVDDVDSDSWIDLNSIDELEAKMSEMTGVSSTQQPQKINEEKDSTDLSEMKNMIVGLESFVKNKSEIEGISSSAAELKKKHPDPMDISPKIFLTMFHKVLKTGTEDKFEDITDPHSEAFSSNDNDEYNRELLQYFTKEDLDILSEGNDESDQEEDENIQDINEFESKGQSEATSMQDVMRAMDAELAGEDLDRSFKVPTTSPTDDDNDNRDPSRKTDTDRMDEELAYDDPTAIQANVLSNLLESLDAQNGKQGPVTTILNEMGIKAPGDME